MTTFAGFGLSQELNTSLLKMNYSAPTPIQSQAIPLALQGRDILGSAQTGTGKTAAFSIPLVEALLRSPKGKALVLTPTRELAKQVLDVIHQLIGHNSGLRTAFIIGGEHMGKQFNQLRNNPRIIVGTPGRINDHLDRGSLDLSDAGFLVLDETDRMLDMGFGVQLDRIAAHLPKQRQTLMFSATLPKGIIALSGKYLNNPERVSVGETNIIAPKIKQDVIRVEQPEKYQELQVQLAERSGSVIIFVKTKHNADRMADKLRKDGHTSQGLHGDLRQNKRDSVMRNFRAQNFRILVATDIAARGLDVPHIEHVINYDLPQVAEDFIHRMGRTARAGAEGSAVSFVASQDGRKWHAIERLLNPDAANDFHEEPQRKNKARRKPYHGRPEGSKRPEKTFAKKHFSNPEDRAAAKSADKQRPQKRSENRADRPFETKKFEGRKFEDRKSEGKSFEGKKFEGKRPQNHDEKPAKPYIGKRTQSGKNKPSGNAKPFGKPNTGFKKNPGSFKQDGSAPAKRRGPAKPNHKKFA